MRTTYVLLGFALFLLAVAPFRRSFRFTAFYGFCIYAVVSSVDDGALLRFRWYVAAGVGLAGLAGFVYLPKRVVRRELTGVISLVTAFFTVAIYGTQVSIDPTDTFLRSFGLVIAVLSAVFAGRALIREAEDIEMVQRILSYASLVVFLALLLTIREEGLGFLQQAQRFTIFSSKATVTSRLLAISLAPLLLAASVASRRQGVVYSAAFLASFVFLFLTGTRSSLFFLPIMWLLLPRMIPHRRAVHNLVRYGLPVLIVAVIMLRLYEGYVSPVKKFYRIETPGQLTETRINIWSKALPQVEEHLFLGHGMGNSDYYLERRYAAEMILAGQKVNRHTVHSQLVETAYDTGIIGLAIYIAILAVIGRRYFAALRNRAGYGFYYAGLICVSGVYLVDMVFHGGYLTVGNPITILFWVISGVIMSVQSFPSPASEEPQYSAGGSGRRVRGPSA